MGGGPADQAHIPDDAREPPHILVFQIAASAELIDPERQQVFALADIGAHVELRGQAGTLAVAHRLAVDPKVIGALDPVEAQKAFALPAPGKMGAVKAGGVFGRHTGVRLDGEEGCGVCVMGRVEAVELPVARHGHAAPAAVVKFRQHKALGSVVRAGTAQKLPHAVQKRAVAALKPIKSGGGLQGGIAAVKRPGRQAAPVQHLQVVPVVGAVIERDGVQLKRLLFLSGRRGQGGAAFAQDQLIGSDHAHPAGPGAVDLVQQRPGAEVTDQPAVDADGGEGGG